MPNKSNYVDSYHHLIVKVTYRINRQIKRTRIAVERLVDIPAKIEGKVISFVFD